MKDNGKKKRRGSEQTAIGQVMGRKTVFHRAIHILSLQVEADPLFTRGVERTPEIQAGRAQEGPVGCDLGWRSRPRDPSFRTTRLKDRKGGILFMDNIPRWHENITT